MVALRWTIVTAGLLLSVPSSIGRGFLVATALLLANTSWRSLRPLDATENRATSDALLLFDLGVGMLAIALSGGRESPFVFVPVVDVLLAGFGRGYLEALAIAGIAGIGLGVVDLALTGVDTSLHDVGRVAIVYALTAVVAGYAHRLFVEVEERQEVAADIVTHLTEANELLSDLHRVARTLPSSLDLADTLTAAVARFHDLFEFTAVGVLVLDPATGTWRVEHAEGVRLPPELPADALPSPLAGAVAAQTSSLHDDLAASEEEGLAPGSRSGLYAPLVARDRLVGMVAVEHVEPGRFHARHLRLMNGLGEPLALAIDNALWFARLRSLGAEGERSRIASELHDGIGQGLAYIALELDRISGRLQDPDVIRLRDDTRGVLREVRETLHQLRTEVTEVADLRSLAETHLRRLSERTEIKVSLSSGDPEQRLPVPVERELWRILQEVLLNVERHSGARAVNVLWHVDGQRGRLEIADDGRGFNIDEIRARAATGTLTMRERANAIGGRLTIETAPGEGTRVIVEVEVS